MSKYKLTFKLKQHTPLIHFQHDQPGATLRATELKPKLDRFILTKLGNGNYEQGIQIAKENGWLIGKGDHPALDYKVRVKSPNHTQRFLFFSVLNHPRKENLKNHLSKHFNLDINIIAPSPYFANNDKVKFFGSNSPQKHQINVPESKFDELIYAVMTDEDIFVELQSFNKNKVADKTLLQIIQKHLVDFFLKHNFGARQNKGFGSFTIKSNHQINYRNKFERLFEFSRLIKHLQGQNRDHTQDRISIIFGEIDNHYKRLKNNPQRKESAIRDWFINGNDIKWEKEFLKSFFIRSQENTPEKHYAYIRALLGLAELFDFIHDKVKIKVQHKPRNDEDKIERFQSPVTYKVIDNKIYLVSDGWNIDKITGEEFWFYVGESLEKARKKAILPVPNRFELFEFLEEHA